MFRPLAGLGLVAGVFVGATSVSGCAPFQHPDPDTPDPAADPVARGLCAVKREPDLVFVTPMDPSLRRGMERRLREDLNQVKKVNPDFLCGLDRIELRDDGDYAAATGRRHNHHTFAHYDSGSRTIRIRLYADWVLFHEIGHHVDLQGMKGGAVLNFRDISWKLTSGEWGRKGRGPSFFVSSYAERDQEEDWASTFSYVMTPAHRGGALTAVEVAPEGRSIFSDPFFDGLERYLDSDSALSAKMGLLYEEIPGLPPL